MNLIREHRRAGYLKRMTIGAAREMQHKVKEHVESKRIAVEIR